MANSKLNLDWSAVEKALAEGTFSGYKIGVIETEKLFKEMLRSKNVPGKTVEMQIKYLHNFFSLPDKLTEARFLYKKIIEEPNFDLSREDTKKIVTNYWQAMVDIDDMVKYLSIWEKWGLKWHYFWQAVLIKKLKKITAIFVVTLIVFLFLGETTIGQKVFRFLVQLAHLVILKIALWLIAGIIVIFLIKKLIEWILKTKKSA